MFNYDYTFHNHSDTFFTVSWKRVYKPDKTEFIKVGLLEIETIVRSNNLGD